MASFTLWWASNCLKLSITVVIIFTALSKAEKKKKTLWKVCYTTDKYSLAVIKKKYQYHCLRFNFRSCIYKRWRSWLYGSWIYNYLCNQCLSPLKLQVRIFLMATYTRYNMRLSLSVTCGRSVVYSRYSSFLHQ